MMKILVTGANGFVGQYICHALCANGHNVVGIVRRPIPLSDWFENNKNGLIWKEEDKKKFEIYSIGYIDQQTVWSAVLTGVDVVIHLAARVHVLQDYDPDPLSRYRETNRYGTELLAFEASQVGVKRFIFISTAKVNGEYTQDAAFSEKNRVSPTDPYAQSKWEAETAIQQICQETNMEFTILRPPLIYGPGVGANFLQLLKWAKSGKPLPFKWVQNKRSLLAIHNLTSAVLIMLDHPQAANQLFLIADGIDFSISELIHCINPDARQIPVPTWLLWMGAFLTGQRARADRLLRSYQLNTQKIQETLTWKPPVDPQQALGETVKWWEKNHSLSSN